MAIRWNPDSAKAGQVEFEGAVLAYPVYHASAFNCDYESVYATVWDGEKTLDISVGTVSYGSSWWQGNAGVDATPEVRAFADAYLKAKKAKEYAHGQLIRDWQQATTIHRGKRVVVRRGRKVPIGTVAEVERTATTYGLSVLLNGKWTSADNVCVIVSAIPAGLTPDELRAWKAHEYELAQA